jgi:hypothetical protein
MKNLIVEEVNLLTIPSRASPVRDGVPIDATTSGHYGGQTPQQGGVGGGRRPASLAIDDQVAGVKSEMEDVHVGNKVQIIDDQLDLDHVNRSLSLQPLLHILRFRPLHRKPAQRSIFTMAFAIISIHQS